MFLILLLFLFLYQIKDDDDEEEDKYADLVDMPGQKFDSNVYVFF